jgi:hypothetical protein
LNIVPQYSFTFPESPEYPAWSTPGLPAMFRVAPLGKISLFQTSNTLRCPKLTSLLQTPKIRVPFGIRTNRPVAVSRT